MHSSKHILHWVVYTTNNTMVSLSKVCKPIYVIVRGRGIGDYPIKLDNWDACKQYITGFPGAEYKKCATHNEADRFIAHQLALRGIELNVSSTKCKTDTMGVHNRTIVYTDGSSIPNVGAGYGIVMIQNGEKFECFGSVPQFGALESSKIPTNNQAELYAIAVAIDNCSGPLLIRTDSEYSIQSLTNWYKTWERNGWKNSKGEQAANKEFIQYIIRQLQKQDVKFEHVRGHCGDEDNERCDVLAKMGARST